MKSTLGIYWNFKTQKEWSETLKVVERGQRKFDKSHFDRDNGSILIKYILKISKVTQEFSIPWNHFSIAWQTKRENRVLTFENVIHSDSNKVTERCFSRRWYTNLPQRSDLQERMSCKRMNDTHEKS